MDPRVKLGCMSITGSQRATLVYLHTNGAHVPIGIAEEIGYKRETVSRALSELEESEFVRPKGHGVWEITEKGREKAQELQERGFRKPK